MSFIYIVGEWSPGVSVRLARQLGGQLRGKVSLETIDSAGDDVLKIVNLPIVVEP